MPVTAGPRIGLALVLALTTACGHVNPAAPDDQRIVGAFDSTPPLRLTLNPGQDQWPVWSTDGQSIWYSYEDLDRSDHDHCLGLIPAAGGTRSAGFCQDAPVAASDSLDVASSPAIRGTRLAWVRVNSTIGGLIPDGGDIVVAPLSNLSAQQSVRHFPYHASSGSDYSFGVDLQWLDDTTLVYVGVQMTVNTISDDTVIAGQEVALIHLGATGATSSVVGGTAGASSVAVGPRNWEIYFTKDGDSRVFHLLLPDTNATTAFDFGGAGIAQDVRILGPKMLAVAGGTVYLVQGGTTTAVTAPGGIWRHPTFRPDGLAFAAERRDSILLTDDIFTVKLP